MDESLCTFGSHSLHHLDLTSISLDEAKLEMYKSKLELEYMFNRKVRDFSFPYGAHNPELVNLATLIGYEKILTTEPSFIYDGNENCLFGRISIVPTDWPIEVFLKIHGAYNWGSGYLRFKKKLKSLLRTKINTTTTNGFNS